MLFDKLAISSLRLTAPSTWRPWFNNVEPQTLLTAEPGFVWDDVPSNEKLVYHDCYSDFKCARLRVPMDWTNDEDNRTVEIAVIKAPATVPVTDSRYGGAVVTNPGGPGGSGVSYALRTAKDLRTLVSAGPETADNETSRFFDIISFDPRGVNYTRPIYSCFPNHIQAMAFELQTSAIGVFGSSETAFADHWASVRTVADACSKRAIESGIGEHMSTASVARDIIEIFERHGEWREAEAREMLQGSAKRDQSVLSSQSEILERVKWRPGEEMVQYWGFSYGTILGATMASMFPGRISRAVLDGVADSFDYYEGGWRTNLQDTDMEILRFGEYCWLGGRNNCALYEEDGPAVILERFSKIVENLKTNPIGVPATNDSSAELATYSDLKWLFMEIAYNPLKGFHRLAEVLSQLEKGNGTGLVGSKIWSKKEMEKGLSDKCKQEGPYSIACNSISGPSLRIDAGAGILCSDAEPQTNITREEYWSYLEEVMGQSRLMGDVWGTIRVPCTQWHTRPKWRYEGNFTAVTAEPIMFIGNTVDNVTPIRNAFRMSRGFANSIVLQQDSEGHCSLSSPSFCTTRAIRKYFQTGELPQNGTVCSPERFPLDGYSEEKDSPMPKGETDEALWKAMVHMNKGD